jgi:TniQ
MDNTATENRFFDIELLEDESLSHFLGRFRRQNYLTATQLGKLTGLGAVIGRWEKYYFNPFPTQQELEALAGVVGVEVEKLRKMLPPKGVTMKPRPVRLCAACYAESPYHRIEWQLKDVMKCSHHQLRLLTKCTNCGNYFPIPGDWVTGECPHCCLPFATMVRKQKQG